MSIRRHIMLVEALRLQTLILESRMEFLTKTFLPKLEGLIYGGDGLPHEITQHIPSFKKYQKYLYPPDTQIRIRLPGDETPDEPANVENPEAKGQDAKFKAMLQQVATEFLTYIVELDPDPLKKNVQWLLTLITRNKQPMPLEDLVYAGESLTKFMQMKKERLLSKERSNINSYKSLSDLNHALRGESDNQQAVASTKDAEMRAQSNIVYDGTDYSIISPQTRAAAGYFGRNTEWCTAWGCPEGRHPTRSDNYFDTYNQKGPMYIITDKSTGELWQFSFASQQYMDVDDRSINLDAFFKQHPKVEQIFENMDGEPIANIEIPDSRQQSLRACPVFALGKGFVIKHQKGPRGNILLQANVASDGVLVNMTGQWVSEQRANLNYGTPTAEEITGLLTKLHITGDEYGVAQLGLYYRDGKWGTLSEVAKPFIRVGDLEWRQVKTSVGHEHSREFVLGVSHDDLLHGVADFGEGLLTGTLFDGAIGLYPTDALTAFEVEGGTRKYRSHVEGETRKYRSHTDDLGATLSRAVTDMLLNESDAKTWDKDSKIKSHALTDEDAERLIIAKPGFGDLVSAYKIHGPSQIVKEMVVDWCEASDLSFGRNPQATGGSASSWVGDNFVIEWFKDTEDLVEELGDDTAKWVNKIINGHEDIEHYDVKADNSQIKEFIDKLKPDVLVRLGKFLQEEHPNEAEEIEDYDPSDADSVKELYMYSDDNDLHQAASWAVEDGLKIGAENEAARIYKKNLMNNEYVLFLDENGMQSKAKEFNYDSPCCFAIPLEELIEYVKKHGEEEAGYNLSDGWSEVFEGAQIKIDQGRYGFDGYDDDAAQERFNDSLEEFLPEDATA